MRKIITIIAALIATSAEAETPDYFKVAAGAFLANKYCGTVYTPKFIVHFVRLGMAQRNIVDSKEGIGMLKIYVDSMGDMDEHPEALDDFCETVGGEY
ncbi:hypothetical protein HMSP1_76 [Sinorhizobium phage HMSP1-Susan]|nr:hypothetical protein HMSP1_76 [Sinorhizobium phage HMSP1-Susan]